MSWSLEYLGGEGGVSGFSSIVTEKMKGLFAFFLSCMEPGVVSRALLKAQRIKKKVKVESEAKERFKAQARRAEH